jgi:hypothetical protein
MMWTRAKTVRFMIAFAILGLALGGACVVVDVIAAKSGESATFSHVFREVWVAEPGVILVVLLMIAFAAGALTSHFFWAGKATYTAIRDKRRGLSWRPGNPAANAEDDARYPEPDPRTAYCGVALVGGWCKRPRGHNGGHACS